jgi:surface antigen
MDKAGACYLRNMLIRARQKRREEAQTTRGNVIPFQAYRHSQITQGFRGVTSTTNHAGRRTPQVHEHASRAHPTGPE